MGRVIPYSRFLIAAAIGAAAPGCVSPRVLHGPAPDFELAALDGGRVKLSDLRGKPVVVGFFAVG